MRHSRRPKESARDTVSYEIDMLRFCAERLSAGSFASENDEWVYLEAFLLHYRVVLEVFSGKHHSKRRGAGGQSSEASRDHSQDLSLKNYQKWAGHHPEGAAASAMMASTGPLDDKYFDLISKYLQHCTTQRSDADRSWDVDEMLQEIRPIIEKFEVTFPRKR